MVAIVAIGGWRDLGGEWSPLVGRVVRSVGASGRSVAVGDCLGADWLAGGAALSAGCLAGVWSVSPAAGPSAAPGVLAPWGALAVLPAGVVRWSAGGGPAVPLAARLVRRTRSVVAAAAVSGDGAGAVCFVGPRGPGAGSMAFCRAATAAGLPLVVFRCGGAVELPSLGAGRWVPAASSGVWAGALRWAPCDLFAEVFSA